MLLRVLLVTLFALATVSTNAVCTQPRVRRAWSSLSASEIQLYKDAVASAMDSGAYIKFIEVHTEMMSEMEAHRQCMFTYWHRRFLAAFENMLRAQGTRFECVTIPYWDWMTDYNKYVSGKCSNMLACSPTLQILGNTAPVSSGIRGVTINGNYITGYCEADAPMNHFCQSSTVSGLRCAKCIPRDNWAKLAYPASTSYASVRAQIFGSANIGEMSTAIENGAHNNVHAQLGSTMAQFESPSDPVFWSHHSMVDALHSIFHKCKIGEQKMTLAQKAASVDWTSCERRNGGNFNPYDYVTMRTGYMGQNPINASLDSKVGKFFSAVPEQFASLIDIRDLGASSYTYELQGFLGNMYTQCGNSATSRRLDDSVIQQGNPTAPTPPTMGSMIKNIVDDATKQVRDWVHETDDLVKRRGGNPIFEAEKMTCMFQEECLGGVTTYTPEFMKRFGLTEQPRCKRIVDRINRHGDSVRVSEWKTQMMKEFGCPRPKAPSTTSSNPYQPQQQRQQKLRQ